MTNEDSKVLNPVRTPWERPVMRRLDAADAEMSMGSMTDNKMNKNSMTGVS